MGVGKMPKRTVREAIEKISAKNKSGKRVYLLKDIEAYLVDTSDIDGTLIIP